MIDQRAARRYAQALFGLAEENKQTGAIDGELLLVREILDKYPEITHLVLNSTVGFEEKIDFLDKVLPASLSDLMKNFIKVLVKKKRFGDFAGIQEIFRRLYEDAQGIKEVTVITRSALKPDTEAKLRQVIEKRLNVKVRLISETDPGMIGGLVLRLDGTEVNASFKQRLLQIRQSLTA